MRQDRAENTVVRDSPNRAPPAPEPDIPRWDAPVDLRQHPTLHIIAPVDAPADPIDWSHYIASRMDAYQRAL